MSTSGNWKYGLAAIRRFSTLAPMLRNNWLSLILLALIGASSVMACWSAVMWFLGAREAQALDFQFQRMNDISTAVQSLAGEAVEFSRRHPSIEPLLQEHNVRPRQAPSAAPSSSLPLKPASKL